MSNIIFFKDSTTHDEQQPLNPPDIPLNPLPSMHYCLGCLHEKAATEFSPDELLSATSSPLRDVTNEENSPPKNNKRKRRSPTCKQCREKQIRYSRAKRAKNNQEKQQEKLPWKEITRMIEEGSIPSGQLFLVSNFFQELPDGVGSNNPPSTKEERKAMAQYVADQYGEAGGFQFQHHDEYFMSTRARGYPTQFAQGYKLRLKCSQVRRTYKVSSHPYGRTRNRRIKETFDCKGLVKVFFLPPDNADYCDIAVEFCHTTHPGREQYVGVENGLGGE